MRKWHRWLSVFFGVFLVWMAFTGVASHLAAMYAQGSFFEQEKERERPPLTGSNTGPNAETSAAGATQTGVVGQTAAVGAPAQQAENAPREAARQAPNPKRKLVGLFHHLHSGESFGPIGTVISLLSGVAMLFFAISGLWMYVQMWRNRKNRGLNPSWLWD